MAKVVVKSKVKKVKRKFPVTILAPEYLNSAVIGNSEVTDLNTLEGKTLKLNLMYVTKNIKNQNIRLTFKVVEAKAGEAKTIVSTYAQIPYYLGRFVKKGSDLVEDAHTYTSKDGISIRVKPFAVTKQNASTMIVSALRLKTRELLEKEISSKTAGEFMNSVINAKIQTGFRNELKKIFPMKTFEFRRVELE